MILDPLDKKILKKSYFLKEGEKQSIWEWALEFFPDEKEDNERTTNYNKIIYRIKNKLNNLFIVEENGHISYLLNRNLVKFQKKKIDGVMTNCLIIFLQI
jgi:hypothetical protein